MKWNVVRDVVIVVVLIYIAVLITVNQKSPTLNSIVSGESDPFDIPYVRVYDTIKVKGRVSADPGSSWDPIEAGEPSPEPIVIR